MRLTAPAYAAIAGTLLLPTSLAAQTLKTIDVPALHKLAEGLGLVDIGNKDYVEFDHQGSRNYTVYLQPVDSEQSVLIFTEVNDVAAGRLPTVPLDRMLEYNDSHAASFALHKTDSGKAIFLQFRIAAAAVTPQLLRKSIDDLLASADETADLWDEKNWTVRPAVAAQEGIAAQASAATQSANAAKAAAFGARNVMFVTEPTSVFGGYHRRATNVFAPGEKLLAYMEPTGFDYKQNGDGEYQFGTSIDLEIRAKDGTVIGGKKDFLKQILTSHVKATELYDDLSLSVNNFPAGDYVVAYTLRDFASDHSASIEQPFTIKAAAP